MAIPSFLLVPSAIQELEQESATVKVSNLPLDATGSCLRDFFSKCGPIESIKFRSPKPDSNLLSKKAFVKFRSKQAAESAMALNGTVQNDRHLQVGPLFPPTDYDCTVLITGLTVNITEEKLWQIFGKFGPIKSVDLALTIKGKWFATITFGNKEARRLATKEHIAFDGKVLKVKRKLSQEKKEAKLKAKLAKMQEAQQEVVEVEEGEEWKMQPMQNPDVDFKNVRSYTSKKKQKKWMEELMGKRKPRLSKEKGSVMAQAREEKKKKKADRQKREKENKDRVKRIKIKMKKI